MEYSHLIFLVLLTIGTSKVSGSTSWKSRHSLSSTGPDVTINLDWDQGFCRSSRPSTYRVKLCSDSNGCTEKSVTSRDTKFDSSESFPLSFFNTYTITVSYDCNWRGSEWSVEWSRRQVDTGPGELRRLNAVSAVGGNRSATVTWRKPLFIGDCVEITVCHKSSASCLETTRLSIFLEKYTFERLLAGAEYTAKLTTCKEFMGKIYRSQPVSVDFSTDAPEAPQQVGNLSVQQEECSRIVKVTWEAPDYDSSFVLNYRVSIGGDVTPTISTVVNDTSASIRVATEPGDRLLVEVRAFVQSIPSIIGLPARWILDRYRILQGTPQGVLVTTLRGTKIVKWKEADPECEVLSYKVNATAVPSRKRAIYSRTRPIFELSSLQSAYSRYVLEISACTDAVGHDCGPPALVEIAAAVTGYPSRPRVELVKQDSDSVLFRWWEPTEPRGPIDGYEFAYCEEGDSFTPSNWVSVDGSERSASVKKLQVGTTYVFHVQAFNLDSKGRKLYSLSGILVVKIEEQLHTEGGGSLGVLGSSGVSSRDCRRTEYSHLSSSKQDMTFET